MLVQVFHLHQTLGVGKQPILIQILDLLKLEI